MSDTTVISPKTFRDLSSGDLPVTEIYRQVGDGAITLYVFPGRGGKIEVYRYPYGLEDLLEGRAIEAARTMATVTGSVSATQVDQQSSASNYAFAGQWVRAGSPADLPVVVSDTDPEEALSDEVKALVTIETAERLGLRAWSAVAAMKAEHDYADLPVKYRDNLEEVNRLLDALTNETTLRTATAVKDQATSDRIAKEAAARVAKATAKFVS